MEIKGFKGCLHASKRDIGRSEPNYNMREVQEFNFQFHPDGTRGRAQPYLKLV